MTAGENTEGELHRSRVLNKEPGPDRRKEGDWPVKGSLTRPHAGWS